MRKMELFLEILCKETQKTEAGYYMYYETYEDDWGDCETIIGLKPNGEYETFYAEREPFMSRIEDELSAAARIDYAKEYFVEYILEGEHFEIEEMSCENFVKFIEYSKTEDLNIDYNERLKEYLKAGVEKYFQEEFDDYDEFTQTEGEIGLAFTTWEEDETSEMQASYDLDGERFVYYVNNKLVYEEDWSLEDFATCLEYGLDFSELLDPCRNYLEKVNGIE